jgi:hypothetical protein
LHRVLDGIDALLEDDLLCRVLEALARKPTPVRLCPVIAAGRIDAPMAQQEGKQLLALAAKIMGLSGILCVRP